MIENTRGIVLKNIKYRETSIITHVFTEHFGLRSYIVSGVRSAKSKKSVAYFQPFTVLDMTVYNNPSRDINRLSEWKLVFSELSIVSDIRKSTISIFLTEFLSKTLAGFDDDSENVFQFLLNSIKELEKIEEAIGLFPLQFMAKFASYLGFGFENYVSHVEQEMELKLLKIAESPYGTSVGFNYEERQRILNYILDYYRLHVEGFGILKSHKILMEVFSG